MITLCVRKVRIFNIVIVNCLWNIQQILKFPLFLPVGLQEKIVGISKFVEDEGSMYAKIWT